jgi:hypothetical protein
MNQWTDSLLPPFDIFRVEPEGHLVWKDTAETLELARLRIKLLTISRPGRFLHLQPRHRAQDGR